MHTRLLGVVAAQPSLDMLASFCNRKDKDQNSEKCMPKSLNLMRFVHLPVLLNILQLSCVLELDLSSEQHEAWKCGREDGRQHGFQRSPQLGNGPGRQIQAPQHQERSGMNIYSPMCHRKQDNVSHHIFVTKQKRVQI